MMIRQITHPMTPRFLMEEQLNFSAGYQPLAERVRESGIEENTLVFFLNDNGGTQGSSNAPLRGAARREAPGRVASARRCSCNGSLACRPVLFTRTP